MNRENFDLSLSIPRRTPGQGGVGPSVQNVPPAHRRHQPFDLVSRLHADNNSGTSYPAICVLVYANNHTAILVLLIEGAPKQWR
jgi:hypothetical protein